MIVNVHLCISPSMSPGIGGHCEKKFANPGVDDVASRRQSVSRMISSSRSRLELAILHQVEQERTQVPRIHLAGVVGHRTGQVEPADDGDAVLDHTFTPARQLAVAPAFRGQVDDHRARGHARHHLLCHQHGRLLSRDHRGCDDDVAFRHDPPQQLALALVEGLVLCPSVAARILGVFRPRQAIPRSGRPEL